MANGDVHGPMADKAAVGLALVAIGVAVVHPPALCIALGGWTGKFVDPDLDHHKLTQSEKRVVQFNPVVGKLWVWYWTPYQRSRPHRGIAHTWPMGTLERFVLALWPLILASVGIVAAIEPGWLEFVAWGWLYAFVGLSAQDILHILTDAIDGAIKRIYKRWPVLRWVFRRKMARR